MKDFKNIEEMKKCISLIEGDIAQTLGYYAENDGGRGIYYIVNDNALDDDAGSVHTLNNGLKAKLIIENSSVNIKCFGAKGNGITDDTDSIQKALDFCGMEKNILIITTGTYLVSKTIIQKYEININFENSCIKALAEMENLYFIRTNRIDSLKEYKINNMFLDGNGLVNCGLVITDSRRAHFSNTTVQNCVKEGINISNTKGWCNDCGGITMNKTIIKISSKDFLNCGYGTAMSVNVADCLIDDCKVINYKIGIINSGGANTYNNYHPYIIYEELLDGSIGFIQKAYNGFLNSYYDDTYQIGIFVKTKSRLIITNAFMYINPNYYKLFEFNKLPFFIKFEEEISSEYISISNSNFSGLITKEGINIKGGFFTNNLSIDMNIDNCQFNCLYNIPMDLAKKKIMKDNFYNKIKELYNKASFSATIDEIAKVKLSSDLNETDEVFFASYPDKLVLFPKSIEGLNDCLITQIENGYKIQSGNFDGKYVNGARIKFMISKSELIYYISYKIKTNRIDGYNASGAAGVNLVNDYYGYCSRTNSINKFQVINKDKKSELWLTFVIGPNEIIEITDINICNNRDNDICKIKLKSSKEYVDVPVFANGAIKISNDNYDIDIIS